MNKEYICKDDKVLIIDENGKQKITDYSDNIEKILLQENEIEVIEENIKNLEKDISKFKKKSKIKIFLPYIILFIITLAYSLILGNLISPTINTIRFGEISSTLFFAPVTTTVLGIILGFFSLMDYIDEKSNKKDYDGKIVQLECLKKDLEDSKEYLNELKNDKTVTISNTEFLRQDLNTVEYLKNFKAYLSMYYDLGYNREKYYKYLQKGKLKDKLGKYYTDKGIEMVKEYLEEKGPQLVKKK